MERLTWSKAERDKFVSVCGGFDGIPMTNEMYQKLAAYEDAEEQGRLVVLPCNVGDTVYWVTGDILISQGEVFSIKLSKSGFGLEMFWGDSEQLIKHKFSNLFLTRKAAEAALRRRKGTTTHVDEGRTGSDTGAM